MTKAIAVIMFLAIWVALPITLVIGWVLNIIKLVGHVGAFGFLELARCIGVIAAPLGSILGLFF